MVSPETPAPRPRARRRLVVALVVLAGLGAVLYGAFGSRKGEAGNCPAAAAETARLDPLVHGEVAALGLLSPARVAPDLHFTAPDGKPVDLKAFAGKALLVNLWATWCVPCRQEMPTLDALARKLGGPDFAVLAINVDTARLERPAAFLQDNGITALPLYRDSSADVLQVLRSEGGFVGLPTTLLVDRHGCELGRMAGPADWASPDALALIDSLKS